MNGDDDNRELRNAFGCFATGVAIVCARHASLLRGFTANSFSAVSLAPPLVSLCLDKLAHCRDAFDFCSSFAVSVLSSEQERLSEIFAYHAGDRFAECDWHAGESGSPIIDGACAWFDCLCVERISLGDHIMLVGEVTGFAYSERAPLVYYRSDYKTGLVR